SWFARSTGSFAMMPSALAECTATVARRPNLACTEQRRISRCLKISKNLTVGPAEGRGPYLKRSILLCAGTTYVSWHDCSCRRIGPDCRHQLWATVEEPRLGGRRCRCKTHGLPNKAPHEDGLTCARSIPKGGNLVGAIPPEGSR